MPGSIKAPNSLAHPWTAGEVLSHDDDELGGGDGLLTQAELKDHIARLDQQRFDLLEIDAPTGFIEMRIATARSLHKDMFESNAAAVAYLPPPIMDLPLNLRKRATELLTHDDVGDLGMIDQFVIDHARERYQLSGGSPAMMGSQTKALSEITQLAAALGLQ